MDKRDHALLVVNELADIRDEIFSQIVNWGLTFPLKDLGEAFEVGDSFEFNINTFEDTDDEELNQLIASFHAVNDTIRHFADVFEIEDDDIQTIRNMEEYFTDEWIFDVEEEEDDSDDDDPDEGEKS